MSGKTKGTALVTGASKGIGAAISRELSALGWEVIGACLSCDEIAPQDRLPGARYLAFDLSRPEGVEALVREVKDVDVLVSNAGASPIGPAEETPIGRVRELFELNFVSQVRLAQALLPGMRARRRGTIVFTGSMRGEAPSPFSSFYSASKAALRSFAECLRMEVAEYGVRVCLVAPMHIRTTLPQEVQMPAASAYAAALGRAKASRDGMIAAAVVPAAVGRLVAGLVEARSPRFFSTVGHWARLQAWLVRVLPRRWVERTMAKRFRLNG
jgi:short-subunit dehydrogenase